MRASNGIVGVPLPCVAVAVLLAGGMMLAQTVRPSFELMTKRMDVDVDGAPTAYGPVGFKTLDYLKNAHYRGRPWAEIVGYLTEDDHPKIPVVQGPNDPAPGYYISQTAFFDDANANERDPRRYVDATKTNYVVRGNAAKKRGVRLGDFVAVHSTHTGKCVFGIVGDDGNPSGDEGSLHLLQALGYPFRDGKDDAIEEHGEIVVRFYPGSNLQREFFKTQEQLDATVKKLGLSCDFATASASKK